MSDQEVPTYILDPWSACPYDVRTLFSLDLKVTDVQITSSRADIATHSPTSNGNHYALNVLFSGICYERNDYFNTSSPLLLDLHYIGGF